MTTKNTNTKLPAVIGAGIGLIAFLAVALLPALLYGGYAGVLLAGGIFGMVLGVTAVAALFAVAGAAAGAAVGALVGIIPEHEKVEEKTKA